MPKKTLNERLPLNEGSFKEGEKKKNVLVTRPAAALKLLITALTLVEEDVTAAGPPGKGTDELLLTPTPPAELDSFDGLGVP